ncbi:TPA: hypothetical protein N0F65_001626, partial [Lagenidium giganteum]
RTRSTTTTTTVMNMATMMATRSALRRALHATAATRRVPGVVGVNAQCVRAFAIVQQPRAVTPEQAERAVSRSEQIRREHFGYKHEFPEESQGEHTVDAEEANRKRIIYRSKQRGWLEVDLLLGSWASQNVMELTAEEVKQYEDILNQETIDIFNYISGKDPVPEHLNTPIMKRLQEYCFSSPLGKASIEGFARNKKPERAIRSNNGSGEGNGLYFRSTQSTPPVIILPDQPHHCCHPMASSSAAAQQSPAVARQVTGTHRVADIWLLGITVVISGQYFGWNVILTAGTSGVLISTVLMGAAYLCFCCCVSEITGVLPFAGGSYGLARCTLGFFPAFLIGCCEAIGYIASVATTMISLAAMVVQLEPSWIGYEPAVIFLLYASVLCVQLLGQRPFWMGNFVLGTTALVIWLIYFFASVGHTDFRANAVGNGTEPLISDAGEFFRVFPFSAWLYLGIEVLNLASDDVTHPKTMIPRAQSSCALTFVVMSIGTVMITLSLPRFDTSLATMSVDPEPMMTGFALGLGASGNTATVVCLPALYACVYGFVWSYTRLLHAMASSRLLPHVLATRSKRYGTAYVAMIVGTVISCIVCVVVLQLATLGSILLSVALLFSFMSYTGQCIGYISLKLSYLSTHRSEFKNPFGILGAVYAICVWLVGIVSLMFCQGNGGKEIIVFGVIVVAIAVFYQVYSKKRQTFSEQENKVLLVAHVMNFNRSRQSASSHQSRRVSTVMGLDRVEALFPRWFSSHKYNAKESRTKTTTVSVSVAASRQDGSSMSRASQAASKSEAKASRVHCTNDVPTRETPPPLEAAVDPVADGAV